MAEDVHVGFGASADPLLEAVETLKEKFEGLSGVFEKFSGVLAGVTAALAGGEAFREMIRSTEEMIDSTRRLMYQTGMAADQAQAWATALRMSDSSGEAFASTMMRMQMRINSNEEAFRAYGIQLRDGNGNMLSAEQQFRNTITALEGLKVGADRNSASLQLLGRGARDIEPFMRAMKMDVEELAEEQRKLGLVVTESDIQIKDAYGDMMVKVHEVLEAVEKTIGTRMMPRLTEMGEKFVALGPQIVEGAGAALELFITIVDSVMEVVRSVANLVTEGFAAIGKVLHDTFAPESTGMTGLQFFKNVLTVIGIAVVTVKTVILEAFEVIKVAIEQVVVTFMVLGETIVAFESGSILSAPARIAEVWRRGSEQLQDMAREHAKKMADIARDGGEQIKKMADVPDAKAPETAAKPRSGTGGAKDMKGPQLAQAQAALAAAEAQKELAIVRESVKEQEKALDDSYKNNLVSIESYYEQKRDLQLKQNRAEIDTEVVSLSALEKARGKAKDPIERTKIDTQETAIRAKLIALGMQQLEITRANAREEANALQAQADKLSQVESGRAGGRASAELEQDRAILQQRKALRQVDDQEALTAELELEDRRYRIEQQGLNDRQNLVHQDKVEQAKLDADREKAEQQHQQRLTQINNQAALERRRFALDAQRSIEQAGESLLVNMMQHVKSMRDIFREFGISVAKTFEELIAKKFMQRLFGEGTEGGKVIQKAVDMVVDGLDRMLAATVVNQEAQTTATVAGVEARTAAEQAGALTSLAITAGTAIKNIMVYAWEAMAGAFQAMASIPYVGPFLAVAAGAAAFAAVKGIISNISGAEKGQWELPQDQLVAMHKGEMAIPPKEAQGLRELINKGGGLGGGMNLTVQALDARSFEGWLKMGGGDKIVKHLKLAERNFQIRRP
jgi:hypothetical protein